MHSVPEFEHGPFLIRIEAQICKETLSVEDLYVFLVAPPEKKDIDITDALTKEDYDLFSTIAVEDYVRWKDEGDPDAEYERYRDQEDLRKAGA